MHQDKKQCKNKFPFINRGISSSAQIWLHQKGIHDSQINKNKENYWIVRDKFYDLSNFIQKHPGGKHWLQYTRGQNITQHYITHHLNEQKTDQILNKYLVQGKSTIYHQVLFSKQGLYRTVKKKLLQKYSINELQDTSKTQHIGLFLFISWFISLVMTGIYQSYLCAFICGYLALSVTGIAHNFVHMKPSCFKYLYLVTGFSPKQWQVMHCLSHHSYANTVLDYQIQAFEPLAYFLRIMPENTLFKIILAEIIYFFVAPSNIILKLLIVPLLNNCWPQWEYLVPLSQLLLFYIFNGNIYMSFKLFLTIHCFFGFIFTKVTFGSHRIQELWTEGAEQIKDFGEQQLYTSNDIYPSLKGGFLSFLIMSGFNIHIVHHMFPTIDNQHLYKADDILTEVCQQRGLKKCSLKTLNLAIRSVYRNYFYRIKWNKNQETHKNQ